MTPINSFHHPIYVFLHFNLPYLCLATRWGDHVGISPWFLASEILHGLSCGVVCLILGLAVLVELKLVTDGQTDGQTHNDNIYRASIVSRDKS